MTSVEMHNIKVYAESATFKYRLNIVVKKLAIHWTQLKVLVR